MGLEVLAGPGCDDVGKMPYVDAHRRPGDVVISAGSIFKAITASDAIPSSNSAALRMALYLRAVAIRHARAKQLNGYVLTSNGNRSDLDRLVRQGRRRRRDRAHDDRGASLRADRPTRARWRAGAPRVTKASSGGGSARYQPSATDREVTP